MKSKGSASLYEVLKSASRSSADPASAPAPSQETPAAASEEQKTLQERLAEYKARKLAAAQIAPSAASTSVAVADPTPVPVAVADPTPPPLPVVTAAASFTPAPVRPSTQLLTPLAIPPSLPSRSLAGPGERVLKITYNTAAFAALVVVGLAFVAYAVGVKIGRARAVEPAIESSASPAPLKPPPAPVPAPKIYSIHLAEWPSRTSQDHVNSVIAADTCKKALEKAGYKNVETVKIMRSGEERLALYIDRIKDAGAESAKSRLAAIQKVRIEKQTPFVPTPTPFAQAYFEEVPKEPAR
jgi:hypothetical protein